MNVMVSLSNTPMAHPPRSNPFLRSSSDAPPFPCITPSTVTCVMVDSFMITILSRWFGRTGQPHRYHRSWHCPCCNRSGNSGLGLPYWVKKPPATYLLLSIELPSIIRAEGPRISPGRVRRRRGDHVLHRAVEEWRPRIVRPATRIPVGFPVAEEHLRGLAVAKPHPGDPAYHQPREPPHRYQSARPLVEEVQRREKPRGRRGKPGDRHGAGQLSGAQSGQRQGAGEHPEADAVYRAAEDEAPLGQPGRALAVLAPTAAEGQGVQSRGRQRRDGEGSPGQRGLPQPLRPLARSSGEPGHGGGKPGQRGARDQLARGAEPRGADVLGEVPPNLGGFGARARVG